MTNESFFIDLIYATDEARRDFETHPSCSTRSRTGCPSSGIGSCCSSSTTWSGTSIRSCAAAASRLPDKHREIRYFLYRPHDEEKGHEEWVLNDLEVVGVGAGDAAQHRPRLHRSHSIGYNYWAADRRHPCSVLGMVYALEVIASVYGGPFASAIKESLLLEGDRGISFISSHVTMDAEHMAELRQILNTLYDADAQDAIVESTIFNFHTSPGSSKRYERARRQRLPRPVDRPYKYLRLEWSPSSSVLRVRTCVKPIQCYSLAAMAELQRVFNDITANPGLVRHFVMTSDVPGVFNFGGDLSLFVLLVRARDLDSLKLYGRRCVDLVWWLENAAQIGVHTTALVQGDTLGGGLESVLPFHKVIFERSAQAGFPGGPVQPLPGHGRLALDDPQGRLRGRQRHDPVRTALHRRAVAASQAGRPRRRGRRRRSGDRAGGALRRTRGCAARSQRSRRGAWPRRSPTSRC